MTLRLATRRLMTLRLASLRLITLRLQRLPFKSILTKKMADSSAPSVTRYLTVSHKYEIIGR
jgi:hypothetical protein